jgi:hypothetical protein
MARERTTMIRSRGKKIGFSDIVKRLAQVKNEDEEEEVQDFEVAEQGRNLANLSTYPDD